MKDTCVNWDKESWLSSNKYFDKLNDSLIKILELNSQSKILDVGCGRGYLLKNLSSKILFDQHLTGVEPVYHKHEEYNKIKIFNSNIQDFLKHNKNKYDFIIFKQVLHLIPLIERNKLYKLILNSLSIKGKVVVLQMDKYHNFPTFPSMEQRLSKSLKEHDEIVNELSINFFKIKKKKFKYTVKIKKIDYIKMIKNKFISILANFSKSEIEEGCIYIDHHYPFDIFFDDLLNIYIIG